MKIPPEHSIRQVRDALDRGHTAFSEASVLNREGRDPYQQWQRMFQAILEAGRALDALVDQAVVEYRCPRPWHARLLQSEGGQCPEFTRYGGHYGVGLRCEADLQPVVVLPLPGEASS